jgi:hypothetical protein
MLARLFQHMWTTEGVYGQGPTILLGNRQPQKTNRMVRGHPFGRNASRLDGHNVQPPGRLCMDATFTSKRCDHSRLRDRG